MSEQYDWEGNLQNQVRLIQEEMVENGHVTQDFIKNNERLIYSVVTDPNPFAPTLVFEALAKESLKLEGNCVEYYDLSLFQAFLETHNPNIDQKVIKTLCFELRKYDSFIGCLIHSSEIELSDLSKKTKREMPAGLSEAQLLKLVIAFEVLFSTPNQFAKWKDESGRHPFLQLLEQEVLDSLEEKTNKLKVEELLMVLAKNSKIHTPDLVARLIKLSSISANTLTNLNRLVRAEPNKKYGLLEKALSESLSSSIPNSFTKVIYNHSVVAKEMERSRQILLTKGFAFNFAVENNFHNFGYDQTLKLEKELSIINLSDTFYYLLEALKFSRQQPENNIPENTAVTLLALREKLKGVPFEDLINISKENSIPSLLIDIASYIEKLNWGQKTFTHKGLIHDFEDFVNNFRIDLIENAGIEGRAYQLSYSFESKVPDNERKNMDIDKIIGNDDFDLDFGLLFGSELSQKIANVSQGHIKEGQNPKELVDGLTQIQGILKQLQSKITKIPIVELTAEQLQAKQFLDEGYAEIESLFQVFPDLTARELFIKLCPDQPVPAKVDDFEWLLGYIESERLSQMNKDIEEVAVANVIANKALMRELNAIFAPDQSVEFTLEEMNGTVNLKVLWHKVQEIQKIYNGLKADKNELDKTEKRYSIFYKKLSKILLEELIKVYGEIAYIAPSEKLGGIAKDKVQVIGKYLAPNSKVLLDSETSSE
jgi:hypothetical protein